MRIAIVYPGDREATRNATPDNNRFAALFAAFAVSGVDAEPVVYHDDFVDQVREQLMQVDGVLVWVNPIQAGRDRSVLDGLLREVAAAGIFVSAHPDVIVKLGTKAVLYTTRNIGWGCDTHMYESLGELRRELPVRLTSGVARVLKQYRGNGGDGVWKVQLPIASRDGSPPTSETLIRVRHATRGSIEEAITIDEFLARCEQYFAADGRMIDQEYQERLTDGMVRCYLVGTQVAGFGHQAVNALFPAPDGTDASDAPQPGPRIYHPPTMSEFQALKHKLETEWVAAAQAALDIETSDLPILWDCDFLLGPRDPDGDDTYVLCEINVSSVAPFPQSAIPYIVDATVASVQAAKG